MAGSALWLLAYLAAGLVQGIEVDLTSASSIKSASSNIAWNMMSFYTGNNTGDNPGNLPQPYYWWEAGAMFMHMVDYYYYTDDPSYNKETIQAICWQAGTDGEFMPTNQTRTEGNDDQVFWAFAAISASELKFPPPQDGYPSYTAMAQAVFNLQAGRWDEQDCGGGLRWQIFPLNVGYDYKNIAANGGFFQLSARLARYTGNDTYVRWAEKMWNWLEQSSLIDQSDPTAWKVYDGADISKNCQDPNIHQYSYNYGLLIGGLAYIYNHTQDEKWMAPLQGVVNGVLKVFFNPGTKIMAEVGCEPENDCNTDGLTFKSFTLRWLAITTQLVPSMSDQIWPYIVASAKGAAGQCDGGDTGDICGYHWDTTTWDGSTGVGQQMSALAAIQANLITVEDLSAPLTLDTGATSKGDANAGTDASLTDLPGYATRPITTGDRAGAGIITFLLLIYTVGGAIWLCKYGD